MININDETNKIISIISAISNSANKIIIKQLNENGLSGLAPSHGNILVALYKNSDGIAMNKITDFINKDKSTVTALVNKLVNMGLIEKIKCPNDSRSTLLKLTKKGEATKPIVLDKISKSLLETTYKDFTKEEKEILIKLLNKAKKNLS